MKGAMSLAQQGMLGSDLTGRTFIPANDNNPPDPPPAIGIRIPRTDGFTELLAGADHDNANEFDFAA
jgi:hypothetical protein